MLAQKIIDEVFACLKPYLSLRRLLLFILLTLICSKSGLDFFNNDFASLSLKEGLVEIFNAISDAEFLLAFPIFFICVLIAPHLNHFFAMQCFKFNLKQKFINDFFDNIGAKDVDKIDIEEKVNGFIVFSKRVSYLLETFSACCITGLMYYLINLSLMESFLYTLAVLVVMSLLYIETTSKVLREYANSVYLLRLSNEAE